jgi:hypothetical protein
MKKRSFLLISWGSRFALFPAAALVLCGLFAGPVSALHPEPGTVIDRQNIDEYKDLIHPVLQAWVVEDGWSMKVGPAQQLTPPKAYLEATEKYASKVRLTPSGELENYVAGFPFPDIDPDDPQRAVKIMWNWDKRWAVLDQIEQFDVKLIWLGSSRLEREATLTWYQKYWDGRVHRLRDGKHSLPNPQGVQYKALAVVTHPYDMAGIANLTVRYLDVNKNDDVWTYVPSIRRIKRTSAAARSDSFAGSDFTLDDKQGWDGKVTSMKYRLVEEVEMLAVMHSRTERTPYAYEKQKEYPNLKPWVPLDEVWEVRPFYVVEMLPKDPNYAYSKRILYIDKIMYGAPYNEDYDRAGKLWKFQYIISQWTEPYMSQGNKCNAIIDVQLNHATLTPQLTAPRTNVEIPDSMFELANLKKLGK